MMMGKGSDVKNVSDGPVWIDGTTFLAAGEVAKGVDVDTDTNAQMLGDGRIRVLSTAPAPEPKKV